MVITDLLSRNARLYGDEVCLVEVNPELGEKREVTGASTSSWRPIPRALAERDHLAPIRGCRQTVRESVAGTGHRQGRQGRNPHHELSRVVAGLLRHPQDRAVAVR